MARIRSLKHGFFTNEDLADCGPYAMLLWEGLWVLADKAGRLEDRPRRIRTQVLPYFDVDVDDLLNTLNEAGFISRYGAAGLKVIQVCNWERHQRPHRTEKPSELPPPPEGTEGSSPETTDNKELTENDGERPSNNRSLTVKHPLEDGVLETTLQSPLAGEDSIPQEAREIHTDRKQLTEKDGESPLNNRSLTDKNERSPAPLGEWVMGNGEWVMGNENSGRTRESDGDPAALDPTTGDVKQTVIAHWNQYAELRKVRSRKTHERSIKTALGRFTVDEIFTAITNYAAWFTLARDRPDEFRKPYPWALGEFLSREQGKHVERFSTQGWERTCHAFENRKSTRAERREAARLELEREIANKTALEP